MNYFIELHRYDGEPLLINTRNITTVVRSRNEFAESYTIVEQKGNVYIIEEKEN